MRKNLEESRFFRSRGASALGGKLATLKGLEPSTSAVTGRRSNQLSYNARRFPANFELRAVLPRECHPS